MVRKARVDFHLFKRRGRDISGGVQAAPLSELRQGLGPILCERLQT